MSSIRVLKPQFLQTLKSHRKIRSFSQIPFPHQPTIADLLKRYDFHSKIKPFGKTNPSDLLDCFETLISLKIPLESVVSISNSCLELGFLRKWEVGFAQLGFPTVPVRVLERSSVFGLEPDGFVSCVEELRRVGLGDRTIVRVLEELPELVLNSKDTIGRIEFLRNLGFSKDEVDRICGAFPRFLMFGVSGRLRPLFGELCELGFEESDVKKAVVGSPKLMLGLEVGELSRCMQLLRSLKCRLPIKDRIMIDGPLCAAIKVKLRLDCLCRCGLIRRDAYKVVWLEPRSILYGLDDIEAKIDYLINEMNFSIDCLIDVPEYLGVNFEKQIVPRHQVIQCLRSKGALGFEVGLGQMVKLTRKKFYNMFVKPYPECEKIFGGLKRSEEASVRCHLIGLWQMFKPSKHPTSRADTMNMKSFMENI